MISFFTNFSLYVPPIFLIIGLVVGGIYYKSLSKKTRLFFFYLVLCAILESYMRIVTRVLGGSNNLYVFNMASIIEVFIFSKYYLYSFNNKKVIKGIALAGILYIVIEMLYNLRVDIANFQSYAKVVSSFVIALIAQLHIYKVVNAEQEVSLKALKINYAILIYFSLEFIFLLPMNFLINSKSNLIYVTWFGHLITVIAFYVYLALHMWNEGRNNSLQKAKFEA